MNRTITQHSGSPESNTCLIYKSNFILPYNVIIMPLNISHRRCQSFRVSTLPLSRLGSSILNPVKIKHQDQPTNNRRGRIPQNDRHNVQRLDKQQRGEDEYSKRRVQEAQCRGKPVASDRDHRRLEGADVSPVLPVKHRDVSLLRKAETFSVVG